MEKKHKSIPLVLFLTFFKIASITIGGGYAMIPVIEDELVRTFGFFSREKFYILIAKAQSIPGVIAFNSALFIGNEIAGFRGAFLAGLGAVLPPFIIILVVASSLSYVKDILFVQYFLNGAKAATAVILVDLGIKLAIQRSKKILYFVSLAFILAFVVIFKINAVMILIGGTIFYFVAALVQVEIKKRSDNKDKGQ